jgi:outer membrane protein OmpA-like peptidoglycan-associated protein
VTTGALGGAPPALQAKPDDNAPADPGMTFPVSTFSAFAHNNAALTSQHAQDIEKLAWSISLHLGMRKSGRATISVVGHTDRSGDEKHNDTLGQQRADATRQALIDALKKRGIGEEKFGQIESTSLGESSPVVPTEDGVRNEKNRRTEVRVTIASQPVTPSTPKFDALKRPDIRVPPDPGPESKPGTGTGPSPDWWRRAEENQRKIDEFDRKKSGQSRSLQEKFVDKVMEVIDPLINKLPVPDKVKEFARMGVRKGLEKGSEAACESAVDATGATGTEAEALKEACKAGLEAKPGELGPP